jgi:prepilin peptidase CpaA
MDELRSFFELLGMLVTDPRTGVLLVLLAAAAVCDYRTFRIPNLITGGGIAFALVYNSVVTPEWHADWSWAPAGMLLGFGAMLPMYAIRAMGAGDVKLMAMVGAFLGASGTAWVMRGMLWSAVASGDPRMPAGSVQSVGKLAYGVSIAAGTTACLVAQQFNLV